MKNRNPVLNVRQFFLLGPPLKKDVKATEYLPGKRVKDRLFNAAVELGLADLAEAKGMLNTKDRATYLALRHMGFIKKIPFFKTLAYRIFKSLS